MAANLKRLRSWGRSRYNHEKESLENPGEGVLTVEEFEKINGAEEITKKDIKHRILVIKINKLYHRGMSEKDLYDAIRGIWRVNINRVKKVEYVFGVYNSLILAVYKPTKWFICETSKDELPRKDIIITNEKKKENFL